MLRLKVMMLMLLVAINAAGAQGLGLVKYDKQMAGMVTYKRQLGKYKNFRVSVYLQNYILSGNQNEYLNIMIWSHWQWRYQKLSIEYRVVHDWQRHWPRQVDVLKARKIKQLMIYYWINKSLRCSMIAQQYNRTSSVYGYVNWRWSSMTSLDLGWFSFMGLDDNRPAIFLRLRYDFAKLGGINLSGVWTRYQRYQNRFFNRLFQKIEEKGNNIEDPKHFFIPF